MSHEKMLSFLKGCLISSGKRFRYVVIPIVLWIVAYRFKLFSPAILDPSLLWVAAILFVLGIPLSLIFGVDTLIELDAAYDQMAAILISLLVVGLNFFLLSAFGALWRAGLRRLAGRPAERKVERKDA